MSELKISVRQGRFVAAIAVLVFATTSSATIYHVPGDYPTIQEAIANIKDGDEVIVAPGTYNEAIDFLGKAIIVRSSDGPDVTTIDATGLNTSVVSCVNFEGPDTVLDGFTITGGSGQEGGGMLIEFSNPCVLNCVFASNQATRGGGVFIVGSTPTLTACTFSQNTATDEGGGMYCNASSPLLLDCTFSGNSVISPFGGGGGMYCTNFSNATLTGCTFSGNFTNTQADGGAMYNTSFSDTIIIDCTFVGNFTSGVLGHGGAVYNTQSSPTFTGCVFTANVTGFARGGAMYNTRLRPRSHCTANLM